MEDNESWSNYKIGLGLSQSNTHIGASFLDTAPLLMGKSYVQPLSPTTWEGGCAAFFLLCCLYGSLNTGRLTYGRTSAFLEEDWERAKYGDRYSSFIPPMTSYRYIRTVLSLLVLRLSGMPVRQWAEYCELHV